MAEDNWSALQEAGEASTFTLIASDLACYLECRGGILAGSGEEGEVTVKVFLRSTAPRDAAFSHVMVHFNLNEYDSFAVNKASDKIVLVTNQLRELEFKFLPLVQHTWERLEITSIDLVYHQGGEGTDKVFKWQGTGGEYGSTLGNDKYISTFKMAPSVYLTPRAGKLACKTVHSGSVLNGEVFPIQVQVENQEGSDVQDIEVTMSMGETRNHLHDDALLECAPSECPLGNAESPTKLCFTHESLASGANCDFSVFGCFMGLGLRKCYIRVLYSVRVASSDHPSDPPRLCRCMKEEVLDMEVVQPFILSSLLKNMKLERQDSIHLDQPFLFVNILNSKSSYPIEILDIQYQKPQCISVCGQLPTVFKDQPLEQDDVSQHCFCLLVTSQEQVGSSLSLGKITIQWRRKHGSEGLPAVSVSEILPTVAVQNLPFIIQPDIPSSGTVNSLLPLSFTLWNKSEIVQEYEIKMIQDDDTHFKVSGNQMHHFRILPGSSYAVRYNLFPTQAGHMNLPIFHMTYCRDPKNYDDYLRHQIPTHIDILPCDKTSRLVQI